MPKILYSPASPYSSKVRMSAAFAGFDAEHVKVDTNAPPAVLTGSNPLGKIPVLVTDDGIAVYDSVAIMQFLNRDRKNALFPRSPAKRLEAERLEALADGICDCALAVRYETTLRPAEFQYPGWIDKQWAKVLAALDHLEANPPKLPAKIHGGHIALAACLGYLALRFEGKWERGHPKVRRWKKRFEEKYPALAKLMPSA
jgi:glutathione S-transferase